MLFLKLFAKLFNNNSGNTHCALRRKSRKFINFAADMITKKSYEVIYTNRDCDMFKKSSL